MESLKDINGTGPCEMDRMNTDERMDKIISINTRLAKVSLKNLKRVEDFLKGLE